MELISYFHINIQHNLFFLHTSHSIFVSVDSPYSILDIPFVGRPFVPNMLDCFKAMLLVAHARSELKDLNYDKFCIENVCYILTTLNGDILFKLPLVDNPSDHFGQM